MIRQLTLASLSVLGLSSVGMAAQNACDFPQFKGCIESTTLDVTANCKSDNGRSIPSCATDHRIGTCAIQAGSDTVSLRYYDGFQDAEKNCQDNKGVYTAG